MLDVESLGNEDSEIDSDLDDDTNTETDPTGDTDATGDTGTIDETDTRHTTSTTCKPATPDFSCMNKRYCCQHFPVPPLTDTSLWVEGADEFCEVTWDGDHGTSYRVLCRNLPRDDRECTCEITQ